MPERDVRTVRRLLEASSRARYQLQVAQKILHLNDPLVPVLQFHIEMLYLLEGEVGRQPDPRAEVTKRINERTRRE